MFYNLNVQAEFLRGKRKMCEDADAEDLSEVWRGSLDENPGSNSISNRQQAREGERRSSQSSVSNTSPTHCANVLSQEMSRSSYDSRMRSPTADLSIGANNSTFSMFLHRGISPDVVQVKAWIFYQNKLLDFYFR